MKIWIGQKLWSRKQATPSLRRRGGGEVKYIFFNIRCFSGNRSPVKMSGREETKEEYVAVAIDRDKSSQSALKFAVDNLITRGQTALLIHVKEKTPSASSLYSRSLGDFNGRGSYCEEAGSKTKDLFTPFRCFCVRKNIKSQDVVLEHSDIAQAVIEYVMVNMIEILVVGAGNRNGFVRFKISDIPSSISKGAPDFCSVYIISKGRAASVRSATRLLSRHVRQLKAQTSRISGCSESYLSPSSSTYSFQNNKNIQTPRSRLREDPEVQNRSSTERSRNVFNKTPSDSSGFESDISFVSSGRPSADYCSSVFCTSYGRMSRNQGSRTSENMESFTSQNLEDVQAEMRRLKLELKQTMEMYNSACKEAVSAKEKANELKGRKVEEEKQTEKWETGMTTDVRYRKYMIEEIKAATENFAEWRKIGEGGYGPVYKCSLDHTPVAVKALRSDASQGRAQFNQEVEILSCIRHPNMVLLLGTCPESGCLVYEYMANGSLEDRLYRKGNTAILPWRARFRIAAEIATGLVFLHRMRPEPLVHRDLKPANVLLDGNFVGKISDVGLARLVPSSQARDVTQYHMTSAAGTFCYIDPEYQQTGMLGMKSDVYSLGVLLMQVITGRPPMGLAHFIQAAVEDGCLERVLDPVVRDWPMEETLRFAKLALHCAELRRKDRPDLATVVLPELIHLRTFAEQSC